MTNLDNAVALPGSNRLGHSMIDLVAEAFASAKAFNAEWTEQNESRSNAATDAIIEGARVTSLADAIAAADYIEDSEEFLSLSAAAAFGALARWLRAEGHAAAASAKR